MTLYHRKMHNFVQISTEKDEKLRETKKQQFQFDKQIFFRQINQVLNLISESDQLQITNAIEFQLGMQYF